MKFKKIFYATIILFLAGWFLYQVILDLKEIFYLKKHIVKVESQIKMLESEKQKYLHELEFLKSDSAIKLLAQKELGMVKNENKTPR